MAILPTDPTLFFFCSLTSSSLIDIRCTSLNLSCDNCNAKKTAKFLHSAYSKIFRKTAEPWNYLLGDLQVAQDIESAKKQLQMAMGFKNMLTKAISRLAEARRHAEPKRRGHPMKEQLSNSRSSTADQQPGGNAMLPMMPADVYFSSSLFRLGAFHFTQVSVPLLWDGSWLTQSSTMKLAENSNRACSRCKADIYIYYTLPIPV